MLIHRIVDFHFVGQIVAIRRYSIDKKSGKEANGIPYGLTSHSLMSANAEHVLKFNRDHWGVTVIITYSIGIGCRSFQDMKGHGPENTTCLPRFATG